MRIRELLTEGGNVFAGKTTAIKMENITPTLNAYGARGADQPDHPVGQQAWAGRARPLRGGHRGPGQCLPGVQPDDAGRIRGGDRRAPRKGAVADH